MTFSSLVLIHHNGHQTCHSATVRLQKILASILHGDGRTHFYGKAHWLQETFLHTAPLMHRLHSVCQNYIHRSKLAAPIFLITVISSTLVVPQLAGSIM